MFGVCLSFSWTKNIPRLTLTSRNASRLHLFRPTGITKKGARGEAPVQ